MKEQESQAAADAAGQTNASRDEELRRLVAEELALHLGEGRALVARCSELASVSRGDRIGPLHAAARLLRANADIAQTLAHVALVERRHRTIVERIQPPKLPPPELNSKNRSEIRREIQLKLARGAAEDRRLLLEQPEHPQQEANLMLEEEDWREENLERRGFEIARSLGHELRRNV